MNSTAIKTVDSAESALAMIEKAGAMLSAAKSFEEVKKVRDLGASIKVLIRSRDMSRAAEADCAVLVLRAERRLGEWLQETPKNKGGRPSKKTRVNVTPVLDDLGIAKNDSKRWQKLASVPEKKFDSYLKETLEKDEIPSAAGARKLVAVPRQPTEAKGQTETAKPSAVAPVARVEPSRADSKQVDTGLEDDDDWNVFEARIAIEDSIERAVDRCRPEDFGQLLGMIIKWQRILEDKHNEFIGRVRDSA